MDTCNISTVPLNTKISREDVSLFCIRVASHARIQRGDRGSGPLPHEQSQNYRVSEQYWSGSPEKNHKATKPAFNGSMMARL